MKTITLIISLTFILSSCSKEENQKSMNIKEETGQSNSALTTEKLTPLKFSSDKSIAEYEKEVRRHIIVIQMDLQKSANKDKELKEKLAICYFRLSMIKEGFFKDHFINKAFETLGKERNEDLTQYYIKQIKKEDEG